jgi:hypothetical protein
MLVVRMPDVIGVLFGSFEVVGRMRYCTHLVRAVPQRVKLMSSFCCCGIDFGWLESLILFVGGKWESLELVYFGPWLRCVVLAHVSWL